MRNEVIEAVRREKLVVIVRGVAREKLLPLAEAMYEGGVRLLEVTFSQDGHISDADTAEGSTRSASVGSGLPPPSGVHVIWSIWTVPLDTQNFM